MAETAELEINLDRRGEGEYGVAFRFHQPASAAPAGLGQARPAPVRLDWVRLRSLAFNPEDYARALSETFFAAEPVKTFFSRALASAQTLDAPLRVRLAIGPDAAELHGIYWEALRNPEDGAPLFTGENIFFSRYVSSQDMRPVKLHPKADLSALVFIANPCDLSEFNNLAAIDVSGEQRRAAEALGKIPARLHEDGPATLNALMDDLREQKPDILYLVCHGGLMGGEPYLWLEGADRRAAITPGKELVTRMKELGQPPLLVVLVSCDSASFDSAGDAWAALGPSLAEAGVPAVVAMQGKVTMQTVAEFMPVFFRALQEDGRIDRAMALGRGCARDRFDFWMPILFTRLDSGCIFADAASAQPPRRISCQLQVAIVVLALLLLAGGGGGYWAFTRPRAMSGGFNIAVAQFAEVDEQGRPVTPTHGKIVSQELFDTLQAAMKQKTASQQFDLRGPKDVGVVWDADAQKLDHQAEAAANKWNASLLIYGVVRKTGNSYAMEPFFQVRDEGFRFGSEVTGSSRLGKPVQVDIDVTKDPKKLFDLNEKLNERVQVLKKLIDGLSAFYMEDYDLAALSFHQALDLPGWEEQGGQEVVYVLLGSAQLRAYDSFNRDQTQVQQALAAFEKAIAANPGYARAYLGLASAKLMQATRFTSDQMNRLIEARDWVKTAQQQPDQPESAYIPLKAATILGEIYFVGSAQKFPVFTLEQSRQYFQQALADYKSAGQPGDMIYYAANAHYFLGYIHGMSVNWAGMVRECTQSSQALERLPFTSRYLAHLTAQAYFCSGMAHARQGQGDQARMLIQQAISVGGKYATPVELKEWNGELSKLKP